MSTDFTQAITANRLSDGFVVYLTARNGWSERIDDCHSVDNPKTAERLLNRARRQAAGDRVIGPYLFKLSRRDGRPAPLGRREIIRTMGPSVGTDLNGELSHVPL